MFGIFRRKSELEKFIDQVDAKLVTLIDDDKRMAALSLKCFHSVFMNDFDGSSGFGKGNQEEERKFLDMLDNFSCQGEWQFTSANCLLVYIISGLQNDERVFKRTFETVKRILANYKPVPGLESFTNWSLKTDDV